VPVDDRWIRSRTIRFDLVNVALATAVVLLVDQAFRFLMVIQSVLILLIFAVILATAIEPIVLHLRSFGLRRGYSVLTIFIALVVAVVAFLFLVASTIGTQLALLIADLPRIVGQLNGLAASLPVGPLRAGVVSLLAQFSPTIESQGLSVLLTSGTLSGLAFATLSFVETIFAIVTVLVIAYFWIAERLMIRRLFVRAVAPERREQVLEIWQNVEDKLGAWARGQLTLMLIVGVIQGIGYTLFGIQFALLLAVWAGLAEVIPMIGPYLGAIPAVLVALTQSPEKALLVVGYTVVVELIESNILVPRVMEHAVGLTPLTVILALLAGAAIYGFVGALLAVPIAAAIQVVLIELAAHRPPTAEPPSMAPAAEPSVSSSRSGP
jgi:predicted PurR-regulated permease PerM